MLMVSRFTQKLQYHRIERTIAEKKNNESTIHFRVKESSNTHASVHRPSTFGHKRHSFLLHPVLGKKEPVKTRTHVFQ